MPCTPIQPSLSSHPQVRKLLTKQGLLGPKPHNSQDLGDDNDASTSGRPPLPTEKLRALYEQHKGHESWLESMGEALPVPMPDRVLLKWLKKLGIVDKPKRRARPAGGAAGGGGGRRAARGAAAAAGGGDGVLLGAVPEPQPTRLLAYLAAMQRAHEANDRWGAGGMHCHAWQ